MKKEDCAHFHLADFLKHNEKFHISRVTIHSKKDLCLHAHDYAEILWIEKGTGLHHINGVTNSLSPNELIMIRPNDRHTFSSNDPQGLTLVNVAFAAETLPVYQERYFQDKRLYFWSGSDMPFHIRIRPETTKRLSFRAHEAMKYERSYLQLDSLLLYIFRHISVNEIMKVIDKEMPYWLVNAIEKYNSPEHFKEGTDGFAELCDKNKDYINRVMKKYVDQSLVNFINERRMDYAANQLVMTDMPIKEICDNCGFVNLAYFYRLFKTKYDLTPHDYRQYNQMSV